MEEEGLVFRVNHVCESLQLVAISSTFSIPERYYMAGVTERPFRPGHVFLHLLVF